MVWNKKSPYYGNLDYDSKNLLEAAVNCGAKAAADAGYNEISADINGKCGVPYYVRQQLDLIEQEQHSSSISMER